MSADSRTYGPRVKASLFGYDLYEAYIGKRGPSASWHKRKESRKARHGGRKQWHVDVKAEDDTSDEALCIGLGCCGWCDWDEAWWPITEHNAKSYLLEAPYYIRPETRPCYYSKQAKSWRPKIGDMLASSGALT